MYYEVYVDTLFVINFVMNLYLLMLTDRSAGRTATRLRIVGAAAVGALLYLGGLVITGLPAVLKIIISCAAASLLMIRIAFRPQTLKGYQKILESLLSYTFWVGGALYILLRYVKGMANDSLGVFSVMGFGGLAYLFGSYLMEKRSRITQCCPVTLCVGGAKTCVNAMIDTGNGLVEPISGKPVSVTDREVLERLWPEGLPMLYRAVPYHSIGEAKGIMPGYLIEKMIVERDGVLTEFEQVYIAVGKQKVSSGGMYELILNPYQLQK